MGSASVPSQRDLHIGPRTFRRESATNLIWDQFDLRRSPGSQHLEAKCDSPDQN